MREITIIPVSDKYRIALDKFAWAVQEKVKEKGEVKWRPVSWYISLSKAGEACVERGLLEHEEVTLKEMVDTWDYFMRRLEDVVESGKYHSNAMAENGEHS